MSACFGTAKRCLVFVAIQEMAIVVFVLGLFQIVGMGAFIVALVAMSAWLLMVGAACCDTKIVGRIAFRDFFVIANIWLAVLASASFGSILEWDYRGIAFIPTGMLLVVLISVQDSVQWHLRFISIFTSLLLAAALAVILVVINLGLLPGQSKTPILYTISGIGNIPLSISAYGTFNDSILALLLLALSDVRARWPNRKRGTLRTVRIQLDGKDALERTEVDLSYLERFMF